MHIWDQCGFAKNINRLNLGPNIQLSRLGRLPEYGYASRTLSALRSPVTGAYMEYLKFEVFFCIFYLVSNLNVFGLV